jgi:transposase
MRRHEVSDKLWEQLRPLIAGQGSSHDNRLFVNAVLFQAKTGIHWRDLPERFGKWNSVYQRFNRWSKRGVWEKIFELTADPDPLIIVIDSTTIRANQVASGQKKKQHGSELSGSFKRRANF